jgi:hypothetical protein
MDDPKTGCMGNGVCPADRVELIDEGADIKLGGVNRDPEAAAEGLIGAALGQKREDLQLARCQPCVGIRSIRVLWLASSLQANTNRLAYAVGTKRPEQCPNALNCLSVPANDYIALPYARRRARAIRIDAHHHGPDTFAIEPHRLEGESEIAWGDPPMGLKLPRHPIYCGRRDYQHAPPWTEHGHAEGSPRRIEGKAALTRSADGGVQFNAVIDLSAPQAPPSATSERHHSKGSGRGTAMASDDDGERTGRGSDGTWPRRLQVCAIDAKQGNIGARVSTGQCRWQ